METKKVISKIGFKQTHVKITVDDLISLKSVNDNNFMNYTIAEFTNIDLLNNWKPDYISESGSQYMHTDEGVYRLSDHWGEVSSCIWTINEKQYPFTIGFCKWKDFKVYFTKNMLYEKCNMFKSIKERLVNCIVHKEYVNINFINYLLKYNTF